MSVNMDQAGTGQGSRKAARRILIVDDEPDTALMQSVLRGLSSEGFEPVVIRPEGYATGEDFEAEALYAIETQRPAGLILDVRFGEHRDDLFKGLSILGRVVDNAPGLPVVMFTQYTRGPSRDAAAAGSLQYDNAKVDFVDKLASPEEVVLRLRRLIGNTPERISIGSHFLVDPLTETVFADDGSGPRPIEEIQGLKFGLLLELASAYHRSQGELVPFARLERFFEGDDARASLRVRIREIKNAMGLAIGRRLGPDDLIINIRNRGYRMAPLRD